MGLDPFVGWRITRITQKEFVQVFCASLEPFGMKWDVKKSCSHVKVCCWSTRSGGVVCGVASVCVCAVQCSAVRCGAVLCCAVLCRVVSCLLCCGLFVVVCSIDIVVLLVVCLLCGEKDDISRLWRSKKSVIVHHTAGDLSPLRFF